MKTRKILFLSIIALLGVISKSNAQTTWNLTGNSGTNNSTNFIGTIDQKDLNFRINNFSSGRIGFFVTSIGYKVGVGGSSNVSIGRSAGNNSVEGNYYDNVSLGDYSGKSTVNGAANTFVGTNSGTSNSLGSYNTFLGSKSGYSNFNGTSNVAIGSESLYNNTSGSFNISLGKSLNSNMDGSSNIALGYGTLNSNISGIGNIGIGQGAGGGIKGSYNLVMGASSAPALSIGNDNIIFGRDAARFLQSGAENIFVGYAAGYSVTTGSNNLYFGKTSGITNGSNNIAIGNNSGYQLNSTGDGNILIGNSTFNNPDFQPHAYRNNILNIGNVIFGYNMNRKSSDNNTAYAVGKIGINTSIPNNTLEIRSETLNSSGLRFTNLNINNTAIQNITPINNKFLTLNSTGDVVLQNLPIANGTTSNTLTSSVNTLTSTVNGVSASALAVNTVVNAINGNSLITSVNGVASASVTLPTQTFTEVDGSVTNELQMLSQTGNVVSLSQNGGSFTFPDSTNIYNSDGVLSGNRTVSMNNNRLMFNTSQNGRVYIGQTSTVNDLSSFPTTTGNYRLYVEGGILTEKVKVALRNSTTNWADYVFASDYKLKPLNEVEAFIKENKHLPGIESADELVKNGLDLGDMQAKQMEKIEELTLYTIEQQKQLDKQAKEIEELRAQIKLILEK